MSDNSVATYPAGRPSSSLHFVVGEMSGKLDQIMASLLPQLQALREADTDHDNRIGALEVWQARLIGGGTLLVFLITSWEIVRYVVKL
jgi:hypothetical protein